MVQTSYDFMSKDYKHVLIQKVTFSTKKELLTQPYTRKPCTNTQKPMCTLQFGTQVRKCLQFDILIRYHDVRMYFTGPHKILHFAGSGHRRILELWGGNLLSQDP